MADETPRKPSRVGRLAPAPIFYSRLVRSVTFALTVVVGTLAIGTVGYVELAHLPLIDAFHQACMLMAGMGPVGDVDKFSATAKLFDSLYALFCGVVLLGAVGLAFVPVFHRLLHRFHIEDTRE